MNFTVLASLIIIVLILQHAIKRQKKQAARQEKSFWERERESNSVRRKPLDDLNYIHIPLEQLPMHTLQEEEKIQEYRELITSLSTQPVVNLTGYTNTDLKLQYGTANLTLLSEYDQNYTLLVRTLQQWADMLLDAGYEKEAEDLMTFAISTDTDVSRTYYKLAKIYAARGDFSRISQLVERAGTLRSSNKNIIVRTLQEAYPSIG